MCVQNCRTFLWGGTGNPVESSSGATCSCICDSNTWADHNILGKSSCVPRKVHVVFAWVGISLAVASLLQATHQLRRQLKYHHQMMAAATAPSEHCRKHMHVTAIANAVLCLLYFSMLLLLEDDRLHWSTVVLLVLQITVMVCGFLTVRMWIYTNDRRMMQASPRLLKISEFLEGSSGQRICYLALSVCPIIGTTLALADQTETAVKLSGAAFLLLIMFADVIFWVFGTLLLLAIDTSMKNSRRRSSATRTASTAVLVSVRTLNGPDEDSPCPGNLPDAALAEGGRGRRGSTGGGLGKRGSIGGAGGEAPESEGLRHLQAAKRKVKWAMIFCAQSSLQGCALLICSIFTKYGTAAPSVLFGMQMATMPLVWHVVNIQLHAGRSKVGFTPGVGRLTGRIKRGRGGAALVSPQHERRKSSGGSGGLKLLATFGAAFGGQSQAVVPVEGEEQAAPVAEAGTGVDMDMDTITP